MLKYLGSVGQLTSVAYLFVGGGSLKGLVVLGYDGADVLIKEVRYSEEGPTRVIDVLHSG
jgi:uncharacterized SAM-binding protein YcdF (DUF218 family)